MIIETFIQQPARSSVLLEGIDILVKKGQVGVWF